MSRVPAFLKSFPDSRISVFSCSSLRTMRSREESTELAIQMANTAPRGTARTNQSAVSVAASTTPLTSTFMDNQANAAGATELKRRMRPRPTNNPGETSQRKANTRGTVATVVRKVLVKSSVDWFIAELEIWGVARTM